MLRLVMVVVLAVFLQTSTPQVVTGHVVQKYHQQAKFTQVLRTTCLVGADKYYACPEHLYPEYTPDKWSLKLCNYTRTICRWIEVGAMTWFNVKVNTWYDSRDHYNPPFE